MCIKYLMVVIDANNRNFHQFGKVNIAFNLYSVVYIDQDEQQQCSSYSIRPE